MNKVEVIYRATTIAAVVLWAFVVGIGLAQQVGLDTSPRAHDDGHARFIGLRGGETP